MNGGRELFVREASAGDLDEILAIESSWPTTPHWTRAHFEAELGSDRSHLCVLESGGRVLGYACMKLVPPEAEIFDVAVRKDAARQGFGRRLLERLHEQARRAGCSKSLLEVSDRNAAALGLYTAFGYRIVGRRPKYYNDGADALLMEAPL